MKISIALMLMITGLVDFIPWSMGKVPYGPLCWVIPLLFGAIWTAINEFCD